MVLPVLTSSHRLTEDVGVRDIAESQKELILSVNSLLSQEQLDGFIINNLTLETGIENHIVHGLNRAFLGWYIIDKSGFADIYRVTDSTADKTVYLPLITDTLVKISIVIF